MASKTSNASSMKNAFSKMESKSNLTDFEDTPKPSTQSNSAGGKSTSSSSTSSVAASTGGVGSGWRQFSYKATVNCTGVATGGNKVAIKKPNTLVSCFETITPNGALVRVSTANLAEVLKDLPSSYASLEVNINRLPDGSENLGPVSKVLSSSLTAQVFLNASSEYEISVNLTTPSGKAATVSAPSATAISTPTATKKATPGALSRLNDEDHQEVDITSLKSPSEANDEEDLLLLDDDEEENAEDGEGAGTRAIPKKGLSVTANKASGNLIAPSEFENKTIPNKLPEESLQLEYVFGYRTRDSRNNLYYTKSGKIVYPAGTVGIVHDTKTNTQRFFHGSHKEDITALAMHPNGRTVATGDVVTHDDGCYVFIWDSEAPEDKSKTIQLRIGDKKLGRGVADTEFSGDGKYLTVIAMDADHTVYIYDWEKSNKPLAKEKGHDDSIFGVTFNPKNSSEFVTYGVKHVKYWQFNAQAKTLKGERGIFGARKVQSVLCAAFLPDGSYITGSHGGEIICWNRNQVTKVIDGAHSGPIFSLTFDPEIGVISGGGKDGKLCVRDIKLQPQEEIQLEAGVRAGSLSESGKFVAGLEDSTIVELDLKGDRSVAKVLEAHSAAKMEELWGLCMSPVNDNEFVTCGDDSRVFKWDMANRSAICTTTLSRKLRAISYSPDGSVLAVGNEDGDIYILQSEDLSQVFYKKYIKRKDIHATIHEISVIKFSPNGAYLAVASHDCVVDIYDVGAGLKLVGCCKGNSSRITHMDWSADSKFLQTVSGDYALLHWSAPKGTKVGASSVRDVVWASQSCILGWGVAGIWEKGMDGTDINWVDKNSAGTLVASGNDFLHVRLHSYPSPNAGAPCKTYTGHGSHVTKVMFNKSGERLITCGGMDGCAMQWTVKKEDEGSEE